MSESSHSSDKNTNAWTVYADNNYQDVFSQIPGEERTDA